jgi:hypothetical protein
MATFKQNTVDTTDTDTASDGSLGHRNKTVLDAAFTSTDTRSADYVDQQCRGILQGEGDVDGLFVVLGEVKGGADYWGKIQVEGGLKEIDINYINAPNVAGNTKTTNAAGAEISFGGGGGAPETPYIPPLTSPGEGSHDVGLQPGNVFTAAPTPHDAFGGGTITGRENPSAQTIGTQTLGDYVKGDS